MTFAQYAQHIGQNLTYLSSEEIATLKQEYRSWYRKEYQSTFRKNRKRVEVLCTSAEFKVIEKSARKFGQKPGRFIKTCCQSYLKSQVYLPPLSALEETAILLRRSGNNVNQLVHSAHILKTMDNQKLTALVTQIEDMKQTVNGLYLAPKIIFSPLTLSDDY